MKEAKPSDYGAKLSINGVTSWYSKYSLAFDNNGNDGGFDYPEFSFAGAAYNRPDDYGTSSSYDSDYGPWTYSNWVLVEVPDDFSIPVDLLIGGHPSTPLVGEFSQSSDGLGMFDNFSFNSTTSPNSSTYFAIAMDQAKDAFWLFAGNVGASYGLQGLTQSLQNVLTVREAVTGLWDDAFKVLDHGLSNINNPNFDPREYDELVDDLLSNSIEDLALAYFDVNGLGDQALLAFQGARLVISMNEGEDGNIIGSTGYFVGPPQLYRGNAESQIVFDGVLGSQIEGHGGNDIVYGGLGNDLIRDGAGNDFLSGGAGDDIIQVGLQEPSSTSSFDFVSGGDGSDTLFIGSNEFGGWVSEIDVQTLLPGDITVNLESGVMSSFLTGTSTQIYSGEVEGIEQVVSGRGNDLLIGSAGTNYLKGNEGDDWLQGSGGNDRLIGGGGTNRLEGGAGYDVLISGSDPHGFHLDSESAAYGDQISGGAGFDTLIFNRTGSSNGYTISLNLQNDDGGTIFINEGASITGIQAIEFYGGENRDEVTGGSSRDLLLGAGGADLLFGGGGADHLDGGEGNDWLDGGAGADVLFGGSGDDVYVIRDTADIFLFSELDFGHDQVLSPVTFSLADTVGIEDLTLTGSGASSAIGNGWNNTLIGNVAANLINGDLGADVMQGGAGNDTYIVDNVGDQAIEVSSTHGTDLVKSSVSLTLGSYVENLTLTGTAAINATGNAAANTLIGNTAANVLSGRAGPDTMQGGAGNDTYVVDNVGDQAIEVSSTHGTDLVKSSVSCALGSYVENLTLTGTAAINATGNAAANTLIGNTAANVLSGRAGADTMQGGAGNDTYVVENVGDQAIEVSSTHGTDLVKSSVSFTLGSYVENLTLTGTAAINATGNAGANILIGNSADNLLSGAANADQMKGGAGNDTYIVDHVGDQAIEVSSDHGTDLVKSSVSFALGSYVENLTLTGTAAINATGHAGANILIGNSADNVLSGLAGADTMQGGAGNDTYVVDNVGDQVIELASTHGLDLVLSSVSYTLGARVDDLTLTGVAAINAIGNAGANSLTGNAAANVLSGGDGNDTIDGGGGKDQAYGGHGADTFRFDVFDLAGVTVSTCDRISDFSQTQHDLIALNEIDANTIIDGDQVFAFIGSDLFHGTAGELRFEQIAGNTYIQGDTNGDGLTDLMIRIDGLELLQAGDFWL